MIGTAVTSQVADIEAGAGPSPAELQRLAYNSTAAFLYSATVLRALLLYQGALRSWILGLLVLWAIMLLTEPTVSRHWKPYFGLYVAVQTVIVGILLTLPGSPDFFAVLFAIITMQVMRRWHLRWALALVGLFAVAIEVLLADQYGRAQAAELVVIYTATNLFLGVFSFTSRQAAEARLRNTSLVSELERANDELARSADRAERLASIRERHRLARDLHDSVTQTLFSLRLTAESALLLIDRDQQRARAQLDAIDQLAQSAIADISVMRDGGTEAGQGVQQPLVDQLRAHLAERERRDGLTISFTVDGDESTTADETQALVRIAQEALNNVVKHAGVSQADVHVRLRSPRLLQVSDMGAGFNAGHIVSPGMGVDGMKERAEEIGWTLTIDSAPGGGTRVRVQEPSQDGSARDSGQ